MKNPPPRTPAFHLVILLILATLFFLAASIKAHGQTVPQVENAITNALPQIAADVSLLKSWGLNGEVTAFTYGTYAPSLKHSLGGGVGVLYHSATNSILGTEARIQYLNIAKQEGQIWQPNLMETASKRWTVGEYFVEPIAEMGVAMDTRCHPYMITGGALAVGRGNFSAFVGLERWNGPYDNFTCFQGGVAWRF
jgi:hypothetical protein